jgi:hypothetical protein
VKSRPSGADTPGIDRGYYVRLGSEEATDTSWPPDAADGSHARPSRRRPVPWFRWVLALVAGGALVWVGLSPGGIGGRLSGLGSSLTGTVAELTQSRELEQATKVFNRWYREQGRYPDYTQSQLDEQTDSSWGAGMDVAWCTPRDVVLTSFTAAGTVSRLLIDGKVVGDLPGRVACPVDLVDPAPWKR